MIFIKKYRSEWKYLLSNQDLSKVRTRISSVLDLDKHTPQRGRYVVHSLYFDDYKDSCVYSTYAKLSKRYKWRIRYYDNDLDYLVLEKKKKIESRCHKESVRITIDEYNDIINNNILDTMYDTKKELLRELAKDILIYNYKPKVIVDYERVAYVEEITNIRITFDMKISASYEMDHFLDGDYTKYYVMPSDKNILEVKFDDILPSYIRNIIESHGFIQTGFSKYYYCRKVIDSYMR